MIIFYLVNLSPCLSVSFSLDLRSKTWECLHSLNASCIFIVVCLKSKSNSYNNFDAIFSKMAAHTHTLAPRNAFASAYLPAPLRTHTHTHTHTHTSMHAHTQRKVLTTRLSVTATHTHTHTEFMQKYELVIECSQIYVQGK